jgi:hypothetical protein
LNCGSYRVSQRASLSGLPRRNPMAPRDSLPHLLGQESLEVHNPGVKAIQEVRIEAKRRSEGLEDSRANAVSVPYAHLPPAVHGQDGNGVERFASSASKMVPGDRSDDQFRKRHFRVAAQAGVEDRLCYRLVPLPSYSRSDGAEPRRARSSFLKQRLGQGPEARFCFDLADDRGLGGRRRGNQLIEDGVECLAIHRQILPLFIRL